MDFLDRIMDFEAGMLDQDETVTLFQDLINTGMVWQLQGAYGRHAQFLIETGLCHMPLEVRS